MINKLCFKTNLLATFSMNRTRWDTLSLRYPYKTPYDFYILSKDFLALNSILNSRGTSVPLSLSLLYSVSPEAELPDINVTIARRALSRARANSKNGRHKLLVFKNPNSNFFTHCTSARANKLGHLLGGRYKITRHGSSSSSSYIPPNGNKNRRACYRKISFSVYM